ncbi:MAG: hypothetical protein AB7V26_00545 [Lysobacterales bacterium]
MRDFSSDFRDREFFGSGLPGPEIGEALRALPLDAPDASLWLRLSGRLPPERKPRWPRLTVAASFIAALLLVGVYAGFQSPAPPSALADHEPALPELIAESAQLEALLAATTMPTASGPALALGADLEDQLAGVDAELTGVALDPARQMQLWRQRLALLRELAGLQTTQQWLAARGEQGEDGMLVLAY